MAAGSADLRPNLPSLLPASMLRETVFGAAGTAATLVAIGGAEG